MPYPPSSWDQKNSSNKRLDWRCSREKNGGLALPRRASLQRQAFDTSPRPHQRIRLSLPTRLLLAGSRDNTLRPRLPPKPPQEIASLEGRVFLLLGEKC